MTLYQLVRLVVSSLSSNGSSRQNRGHASVPSTTSDTSFAMSRNLPVEKPVSRKGSLSTMTSLGEVMATVEAKRISSGAFPVQSPVLGSGGFPGSNRASIGPNTDAITDEIRVVLKTARDSCPTLFRDLQIIACFVPAEVLDMTDMGKAFWDVSIAALSLKEEYLQLVTNTAHDIFQYSSKLISSSMDTPFLSRWTLEDSAWLWSIAAKEGDTEAQRELAIVLLSHPHIIPFCLAPFSKLSDTFSPTLLEYHRITEDSEKMDPILMSVVDHWMTRAANHGDNMAREYLEQQGYSGYNI